MPEQIAEKQPAFRCLLPWMRRWESRAIRAAAGVVAVCDALADIARSAGATNVTVLNDISLLPLYDPIAPDIAPLPLPGTTFLYVGNLEPYQGIDLLLSGFAKTNPKERNFYLALAGGSPRHIHDYRAEAERLGVGDRVHFLGPKPVAMLPHLFNAASAVVSPRTHGGNTPMKIYSYLDSGCPVIATKLPTHTQVLDHTIARLTDPTPHALAQVMLDVAAKPEESQALAAAAKQRVKEQYSFDNYRQTLSTFYQELASALLRT